MIEDRTVIALHQLTVQELETRRLDDADLGYPVLTAAAVRHDVIGQRMARDVDNGATWHTRLPWAVRQVPRLVAVIDLIVLFTFCAVVFNVPIGDPMSTPVASLAALFLAVLASGVTYSWLAVTGCRLKTYRAPGGEIVWEMVGRTTRLMAGVSLGLVAVLGVLMYSRIAAELGAAGDDQGPLLGVIFALVSAVANLSVVAVHALDGTVLADERRRLGRLLERRDQELRRARRALARCPGGHGFSA